MAASKAEKAEARLPDSQTRLLWFDRWVATRRSWRWNNRHGIA